MMLRVHLFMLFLAYYPRSIGATVRIIQCILMLSVVLDDLVFSVITVGLAEHFVVEIVALEIAVRSTAIRDTILFAELALGVGL